MGNGRDYTVGYGKPPPEHRFKPGRSGNPRGRPRGARGFKADVEATLSARISVNEQGRSRRISVQEAVLKRLVQKGLGDGDIRALARLLALAQQVDSSVPLVPEPLADEDRALLEATLSRLAEERQ